ncbi:UDP-4-amino-4,6-dideoxy-N-acetyl-beta-L-altrosamine transaminase [Idiomarina tyrosinivorans]|uniref:UDP-4-amino-4, 6-dideoxy-N-acetyl-beta-L-altrosamine transaminase n=1 Tax=Idiomarina tyrosinivorans TaxID=1445662 RepID=A0A432ZPL4_9GAMM|nr:UDP-4-amino-4,6-dideoxy-N-acetyl-beta-L-altrosamine transaminase [Idiomarina tyrosinivorans]RUO79823.1 UDP-4-amino-4,6-dideoxy-N-acetyl-beta-L-altrosamine transaminase [Idiomarina tyrosinivorans]
MIPYGRQNIEQADIDAVVEVLGSDFLTQGPQVPAFEEAIKSHCDVRHAVAVNSATSALHIACMALGLGLGDMLWTTPNTFVASANCARYCGADVDFVDIDPLTYNLSAEALADKLAVAERLGRLPKIIVVVHFSGQSCDMERIAQLAQKYGVRVIEDASHAIGATYQNTPVGRCQYSDICVFSFHPVKIVTTAEGGVATTQSETLAERMREARSHGITRDPSRMQGQTEGDWYYQQISLGYNYRMTELQAALGVAQMARLETFVAARNRLAERYDKQLATLPLILPGRQPQAVSAWHLYVVQIDDQRTDISRKALFEHCRANNIGVNVHYIPVHLQPYYQKLGFKAGDFPNAERYYQRAISIPLFAQLTEAEQGQVVAILSAGLS